MWLWLLAVAHAQSIYNPIDPRPTPPQPGATHAFSASVDVAVGNTNLTALAASAGSSLVDPHGEWRVVLSGKTSWSSGERISQAAFGHVRRTQVIAGPWRWVSFAQASANPFQRLYLRALLGTGIELTAYPTESLRLSIATTVLGEEQVLEPGAVDEDRGLHARSSSYGVIAAQLHSRLAAGLTVFAQPRLDQPSNLRVSADAFLTIDLSATPPDGAPAKPRPKGLIRQGVRLDWDSTPPDGVEPLDVSVTTSFALAIK